MIIIPPGAGTEAAYLVPVYVLGPTGPTPTTVMRFASHGPAHLEWNIGDTGQWTQITLDYLTSPHELPLRDAAVIKIRRLDKGSNPVTADFA